MSLSIKFISQGLRDSHLERLYEIVQEHEFGNNFKSMTGMALALDRRVDILERGIKEAKNEELLNMAALELKAIAAVKADIIQIVALKPFFELATFPSELLAHLGWCEKNLDPFNQKLKEIQEKFEKEALSLIEAIHRINLVTLQVAFHKEKAERINAFTCEILTQFEEPFSLLEKKGIVEFDVEFGELIKKITQHALIQIQNGAPQLELAAELQAQLDHLMRRVKIAIA